jgi:hypothetical protein
LIEERLREPAAGYVRVKVQACGVCHSDSLTKEGLWPGLVYPRSPGQSRRSGGDRLARRTLRQMRIVPTGRLRNLCEIAGSRDQL